MSTASHLEKTARATDFPELRFLAEVFEECTGDPPATQAEAEQHLSTCVWCQSRLVRLSCDPKRQVAQVHPPVAAPGW